MQKIVNIVAVASGVVSLAVVGSGLYVYLQRDKLINNVKSQVMEAVSDSLPGLVGSQMPKLPRATGPVMAPPAMPSR
tara:strand:+ start:297 stop:527 length:231 start_codon:yes stop_codon:yes gene_type:complete